MNNLTPTYTHWSTCRKEDDGLECICQEFYRCDECLQLVHFTEAVICETISSHSLVTFPVACNPCASEIAAQV